MLKPKERLGIIDYDSLLDKHKQQITRNAVVPSSLSNNDDLNSVLSSMSDAEGKMRRMSMFTSVKKTAKVVC